MLAEKIEKKLQPALQEGLIECINNMNPGSVVPLAKLFGQYADRHIIQAYDDLLQFSAGGQEVLADGYLSPEPDFPYLATLPAGTLGYAYYHYFVDNGLNPDLLRKAPTIGTAQDRGNAVGHLYQRHYQLHDLSHIVTGFDITPIGEVKVVSFTVAQSPTPYPSLIIAIRPFQRVLFDPANFATVMDAITEGWQLGKRAKNVGAVHWEEMWESPLDQLRRDYNLIAAV